MGTSALWERDSSGNLIPRTAGDAQRKTKEGEVASAVDASKKTMKGIKTFDALPFEQPKIMDGESPAEYGRRLAAAREAWKEKQAQSKALSSPGGQ